MEDFWHKINFNEILNPKEYAKFFNTTEEIAFDEILTEREHQNTDAKYLYQKVSDKNNQSKKNMVIPLKSTNFNQLLGGGFQECKIYLLYGRYASGKSQICHHLCVSLFHIHQESKRKPEVLFIDTEGTFRPERILEISKSYDFDGKELLKRINVMNARNTESLNFFLARIEKEGLPKNIKLIIIDSFTNWIRVELGDLEGSTLKVRNNLISILEKLQKIKKQYKIPIVLTSQVRSVSSEITGFNIKPIMEYVLNEYVDESILLSRNDDDKKFAFLVNSTSLPENNVQFELTVDGVVDAK
jgi:DNA repair protein RadA